MSYCSSIHQFWSGSVEYINKYTCCQSDNSILLFSLLAASFNHQTIIS